MVFSPGILGRYSSPTEYTPYRDNEDELPFAPLWGGGDIPVVVGPDPSEPDFSYVQPSLPDEYRQPSFYESPEVKGMLQDFLDRNYGVQKESISNISSRSSGAFANNSTPRSEMTTSIQEAARQLGIDPVDLATAISYETNGSFRPDQPGPTTHWGQHTGLIQFGEPQARQYGVYPGQSFHDQMLNSVVPYLRENGVTPGMGLLDIYSTILAGAPGRYNRRDIGGTVASHVQRMSKDNSRHRKSALSLVGVPDPTTGKLVGGGGLTQIAALGYPPTREGVMAFQRDHGATVDGIIGPETRTALASVSAAPQPINIADSRVSPALMAVVDRAKQLTDTPFGMYMTGGGRNSAEQEALVRAGWSKTQESQHLGGNAIDLIPRGPDGLADPNNKEAYSRINSAMEQASRELGIPVEWGGNWKGFQDLPHYQVSPSVAQGYQAPTVYDPLMGGYRTTVMTPPPMLDLPPDAMAELVAANYPGVGGRTQVAGDIPVPTPRPEVTAASPKTDVPPDWREDLERQYGTPQAAERALKDAAPSAQKDTFEGPLPKGPFGAEGLLQAVLDNDPGGLSRAALGVGLKAGFSMQGAESVGRQIKDYFTDLADKYPSLADTARQRFSSNPALMGAVPDAARPYIQETLLRPQAAAPSPQIAGPAPDNILQKYGAYSTSPAGRKNAADTITRMSVDSGVIPRSQQPAQDWAAGMGAYRPNRGSVVSNPSPYTPSGVSNVPVDKDREANMEYQRNLRDMGFDPGPIDGVIGRQTLAAIAAMNSLMPDADVSPLKGEPRRQQAQPAIRAPVSISHPPTLTPQRGVQYSPDRGFFSNTGSSGGSSGGSSDNGWSFSGGTVVSPSGEYMSPNDYISGMNEGRW